jgi:hypothetical protein
MSRLDSTVSQTERRFATRTIQISRRPTCNQCPHPGRPCPFQKYSTSQPRGPIPPKRSSSLPRDSRVIEAISNPSAALATFCLDQQDGYFFEYMLTGSLNKLELFSMTQLWPMVIDKFHSEPCVRHIMLGNAMIHRSRSDSNMSRYKDTRRLASRHYSNAVRLLSNLSSPARNPPGGEARKVIILATFLLAVFELLRRKNDRAGWWMKTGLKLLSHAQESSKPSPVDPKMDRSAAQLTFGYELMGINLKIKNMKTLKRRERSLGNSGAGGSRKVE